jgi:hypothetical protein
MNPVTILVCFVFFVAKSQHLLIVRTRLNLYHYYLSPFGGMNSCVTMPDHLRRSLFFIYLSVAIVRCHEEQYVVQFFIGVLIFIRFFFAKLYFFVFFFIMLLISPSAFVPQAIYF